MITGKKNVGKFLMTITVIAAVWSLNGCGGGGSSAVPAAQDIQAGHGRLAAELHFQNRTVDRAAAAAGDVVIDISITGYYEEDDSVFPVVTASTELAPTGGGGKVTIIDVPIGKNHLLTAVATWPDGVKETIKSIISTVAEGETTTAYADPYSTVVADAVIALAKRNDVILSKVSSENVQKIETVVGSFLAAGYGYNEIDIQDVLDYDTTGNVVTSVEVAPATATVGLGGTVQFTAVSKNTFGITITNTSAVTWTIMGKIGTLSTTGLFTASSMGEGTITATVGTLSGSATVTVSEAAASVCGNSVIETGEVCDDGNTTTEVCTYGATSCTVCDASCATVAGEISICGDSTIDSLNNEVCDDGNTTTEACAYGETSCTVCNASCSTAAGEISICGDGMVDSANETCDDGNTVDIDGCSSTCAVETPPYLVGKYIRSEFCAPPTITSGAEFFTTKRAIESDGYGHATMTLLEHSQGFATGPRTIPFTGTAGSHSVSSTGGRITAFSDDGNVMLRTKTGMDAETEELVSVMCIGVGIRANDENSAPLSAANLNGTYIAYSIGAGSGAPWTSRESVVFDGSGGYSSTFLSASFETGINTTGSYTVDANGTVSLINTGSTVEASGMITPDGNVLYLARTDTSNGDPEVYLSVAFKTSTAFNGLTADSRYGMYMMGVDSGDGLWADAEHGIVDADTKSAATYNTMYDSNNSLDSSAITITYDTDGQFTTSEGNYGMVSPDSSLLLLIDTDLTSDYYINMGIGVYSGAAGAPVCGNGRMELTEACDDAGENGVVCSAAYDSSCAYCSSSCTLATASGPYCGDGMVNGISGAPRVAGRSAAVALPFGYEDCDDGGSNTDTPCTASYGASCNYCSTSCVGYSVSAGSYCGDGITDTLHGEGCDDGNLDGGDGCSSSCVTETLATNAWITIPAGDFIMGNPVDQTGGYYGAESPKHTVTMSEYKIQKYEVTNLQYAACVSASVCSVPGSNASYTRTSYYGNAAFNNYPVTYVNWQMANIYCQWIGGALPTEAQWEKAARGPSPMEPLYPWGDTIPTCSNGNYGGMSGGGGCVGDTSEVGSFPLGASYYGVMDMFGNLNEWVYDWIDTTDYLSGGPVWVDPLGTVNGGLGGSRGGSWMDGYTSAYTFRLGAESTYIANDIRGIRCVMN